MDKLNNFYENFWKDFDYVLSYNLDSAVRDRFPSIQKVWGSLFKPQKVLDFGCGNGVLTYWLYCNQFASQITGIDISKTGIENARKAFVGNGLAYNNIDLMDSSLDGEHYDVAISSHVLEHIPEPQNIVKALSKKAEWLVLEVPLEQCFWFELKSMITGKAKSENDVGHINFWSKKSFKNFIEDSGLLIVRDFHYASAPFSPFNSKKKRFLERVFLALVGLNIYSYFMATHYCVLARRKGF